ncbi:hypothetical protein [Corallococcus sp. AB038B]|uniref:hypothetical protein n=1 Tax=Corallococcus sp. AB038B TaxID=2316718 RepID=UPI000ED3BE78|nr:hypothetical protein [Corallococcus sp. AB038B]RKH99593.1 hypothetical protein D7Y04_21070 [Corallococcus sp. AB038B]
MSVPSMEALRQDVVRLRALLERNVPRYAATRRDVALGPDESAHVRAFWETLGWSPLFEGCLGEPELARAPAQAERSMGEWRSWGGPFRLTLADLPRRFRFAEPDHQGVGFSITDESSETVTDPPLLAVVADTGQIVPHSPSYLRFAGDTLVRVAVRGWYSTTVMCRPDVPALPGTSRPFPFLSPGTVALSEDLWVLPSQQAPESPGSTFVHARYEALLEWLVATPALEAVNIPRLPGKTWTLEASLARVDAAIPGLKSLAGLEAGTEYRVGTLEGAQVLVQAHTSGLTQLAHNARHAERLQAALTARGLLKPSTD